MRTGNAACVCRSIDNIALNSHQVVAAYCAASRFRACSRYFHRTPSTEASNEGDESSGDETVSLFPSEEESPSPRNEPAGDRSAVLRVIFAH